MKTVDEPGVAGLLARRQDGRVRRRCAAAIGDIFIVDLDDQARSPTSPTTTFGDYAPTYSPDGKSIVYIARVSGNEKLFRLDLDTSKKTQLTFGTHDETAAQFLDDDTLVFSSTATDPTQPIDPEVAQQRQHLQHLDARPEDRRAAAVHRRARRQRVADRAATTGTTNRIAFVTYYKGEYEHPHARARRSRCTPPRRADFGAPGPIIDFQAPLQHTLVDGERAARRARSRSCSSRAGRR